MIQVDFTTPPSRLRGFALAALVFAAGACGRTQESVPTDAGVICGPGSTYISGTCEATGGGSGLRCGAGTILRGGECVRASGPTQPLACGTGTTELNGLCVRVPPDAGPRGTCGPGTRAVAGRCTTVADAGGHTTCGVGTVRMGDVCVAAPPTEAGRGTVCGSGTQALDGACVAARIEAGPGLSCGSGTHEADGACVSIPVDAGKGVACGVGTHEVNGACVAILVDGGAGATCGAETHEVNGVCVPIRVDAGRRLECGAGTVEIAGECRALADRDGGAHYEVRVDSTDQPADGYSLNSILVVGTNVDGTPALGPVVLTLSRSDAGTLSETNLTLTSTGAASTFEACNSFENPSCAGTFTIALALASEPNEIVATSPPVRLFTPGPIGDPARCLVGGDVFYLNGDPGSLYPGTGMVTAGRWSANNVEYYARIRADDWEASFSTRGLNQALTPGVYLNSVTAGFDTPGHAGLSVTVRSAECESTGDFQIQEATWDFQDVLRLFTSTFELRCNGSTATLRGCVHFEQ